MTPLNKNPSYATVEQFHIENGSFRSDLPTLGSPQNYLLPQRQQIKGVIHLFKAELSQGFDSPI